MAYYVIQCPKCGGYTRARRSAGAASAAWRRHIVERHVFHPPWAIPRAVRQ